VKELIFRTCNINHPEGAAEKNRDDDNAQKNDTDVEESVGLKASLKNGISTNKFCNSNNKTFMIPQSFVIKCMMKLGGSLKLNPVTTMLKKKTKLSCI
jgi:hypothetical protein